MIAEELINQMIPPLKLSDSAGKANSWMGNLRLTQLPVVNQQEYKGIITENAIEEYGDLSKEISTFPLEFHDVFVHADTHFYDVIKIASKHGVQIVPVLDDDKKFIGVISVNDASAAIANLFASQGPGGIIVLAMKEIDYSLAQISRLVESNEAKIMSAFVTSEDRDPNIIRVTLKLDRIDLTRIVATLERYSYQVVAQFQETPVLNNDQDRLDLLFKYLNI